ncbi:hypothetical protein [Solitalea lacus]|uniref:hypothetical protein n=1 Tax=Solitalea lacus TaxID=2911172 RepID=UPI001EDB9988|nr:hypothetical protein [Solitalea lacus]UKJ05932.1 hypothetical protein L2B55_10275 [Solitalea lacus]
MKTQNKKLSLEQAKKMVDNYRNNALKHVNGVKMPNSIDFSSESVQKILSNPECKGIRAYFAEDEKNQVQLFLVGYNEAGADVLPQSAKREIAFDEEDGGIDPPIKICPPDCGLSSF